MAIDVSTKEKCEALGQKWEEKGNYCDLSGSNLERASLHGSNLKNVDLDGSDLEGSSLYNVNLRFIRALAIVRRGDCEIRPPTISERKEGRIRVSPNDLILECAW